MRRTKIVSLLLLMAAVCVIGAEAPEHAAAVGPPRLPPATPRHTAGPQHTVRLEHTDGPEHTAAPDDRRTVALTFDDGPSPWTPRVLAVLRRHHVHATFCMLGDEAARYPAYARQVVADGHQLCNHSRDHADMARLSAKRARREVVGAERQIRDAAGAAPLIFRYPYGSSDRTASQVVRRYGMRELSWDVDPKDWTRPAATTITSRIVGHVRPHSVVLMHDGGGDRGRTVASLDATITQLQRRGYQFVLA